MELNKMKIRLAGEIQSDSIVDGEGIRTVIWTQGCPHHCPGCHNPETHCFDKGMLVEVEEVKEKIKQIPMQDGITLSGGDPLCQPEACAEIAEFAKEYKLNVWCYTGYTFEQLQTLKEKNVAIQKLLENIDVLVDGKFVQEVKSLNLYFRGSRNQRILDMKESLKENKPIEIKKYMGERGFDNGNYGRNSNLYI